MKRKVKKVIIWVVILIFVLLIGWRVYELVKKDESASRGGFGGVLAVETELMRREIIREVREFSGSVRPAYQYVITAKVPGRLEKLFKQTGDYVSANEIIAVIDDAEYQLALLEAQANLADSESQQFAIEQDFKKSQALFDKEYMTLSEFEQAQSAYILQYTVGIIEELPVIDNGRSYYKEMKISHDEQNIYLSNSDRIISLSCLIENEKDLMTGRPEIID